MTQPLEPGTPTTPAEPTVPSKTAEEVLADEVAALKTKTAELQAQKEHWREKYDRDITSIKPAEPVPSEPDDVYSDEGKALQSSIAVLNEKFSTIERREARREAEIEFPFLKDKQEEFDEFLADEENKRLSIRKAARLFAAEKGLLSPEAPRKGLEKPTGGGGTPPETGISDEDAEHIRKTDSKKYEQLIRSGKIK